MILNGEIKSNFRVVSHEVEKIIGALSFYEVTFNKKALFMLNFALRELFNNSVEHGNKMDDSKRIKYKIEVSDSYLNITIRDEGKGFNLYEKLQEGASYEIERNRNRGLLTLREMGFDLEVKDGAVVSNLDLIFLDREDESIMEMKIDKRVARIKIMEKLIAPNMSDLVENIKTKITEDKDFDQLVIDLSGADSIDSTGITFLIGIYKTLKKRGIDVILTGVSSGMLELFKIMKLDELFDIRES